jgi:transcriptional regulator with XRE-family HTH domain
LTPVSAGVRGVKIRAPLKPDLEDGTWFSFNDGFGECNWQLPNGLVVVRSPSRLGHVAPSGQGEGLPGVPTTDSSPIVRRRELGALLRALRTEREWTTEQVAERLLVSSSKVSRLETGQRGASARDMRDLCDLYEVGGEQRERLLELARQGKQRAWWQQFNLPNSTYVGLEAEATSISDHSVGIMPGLLQTPEYTHAVVRAAAHIAARGRRAARGSADGQTAAAPSEHPPSFETVVDESVLHRVVGSPAIMQAQLKRLLEVSALLNVLLRVARYDAGALPAGNDKFIILRFALPTVPDVVFVEGLTGGLYLDDPHDIEVYNTTFGTLVHLAADRRATRGIIAAMIASYEDQLS